MDWLEFDRKQIEFLKTKRFRDAEERLLEVFENASRTQDYRTMEEAAGKLGHFYSLPLAENLQLAEFYFREQERLAATDLSRFETALFRFICLSDFGATLAKLSEISNEDPAEVTDARTNFRATALKGLCWLRLGELAQINPVLRRLIRFATLRCKEITYGDCFNFVREVIESNLNLRECLELLQLLLKAPLSPESREEATHLRRRAESRLAFKQP